MMLPYKWWRTLRLKITHMGHHGTSWDISIYFHIISWWEYHGIWWHRMVWNGIECILHKQQYCLTSNLQVVLTLKDPGPQGTQFLDTLQMISWPASWLSSWSNSNGSQCFFKDETLHRIDLGLPPNKDYLLRWDPQFKGPKGQVSRDLCRFWH